MLRVPVIAIGLRSTSLMNRPPILHIKAAIIKMIFADVVDFKTIVLVFFHR